MSTSPPPPGPGVLLEDHEPPAVPVQDLDGLGSFDLPGAARGAGRAGRRFGPRVGAPNARAVLGGALVAIAVLAAFVLTDDGPADPGVPRVVAARDVAPGSVLEADDLTLARLALPAPVDAQAFAAPEELIGSVTLGPVGAGEVLQRAAVVAPDGDAGPDLLPQVSVAVEADRALGGRVRVGERVDVVATFGSGADATTRVEADDVTVVALGGGDDPLGAAGKLTVTLALPPEDVLDVAHAAEVGGVRLVRTTGTGSTGSSGGDDGDRDVHAP